MLWTEDQTQKRVPIEAAITNKALRIYEKKLESNYILLLQLKGSQIFF